MEPQRADRERMKTLLVEAIATLCRNGLQYEDELCVEGLIGITVDKSDVFLVSVKESFTLTPKTDPINKNGADLVSHVSHSQNIRRGSKRAGIVL